MKRNVLSFFKSSACAKSFFVFGAAFLAILSISCKQLASFDPVVNGEHVIMGGGNGNGGGGASSSVATEFSFNLKATHGLKRKISLEWTAFSGAKYYEIYFAESATAEFAKINETDQPFFNDVVAAGRTGYFKVCAVKANGTRTPFSSTVVGTSLAVPVISGGEVSDSSATITWFMENARSISGENYYEDLLKFEVFCGEKSQTLDASSFEGGSYRCTFENLAGSTDYEFYVRAYLSTDQQSYEESPKVTNATLTSYMPLAPVFNASEGESAKGIRLYITLPEMVMVKTVTNDSQNEEVDEPYPLCFNIYRRSADGGGDYGNAICKLYYNGSTEPPTVADYNGEGDKKRYNPDTTITWFDESANLQGGVKYEYMIRSFVDINYSKVVCPAGKEYEHELGTATDKATKGIGWKSAHPSFRLKIDELRKTLSENNTEVLSYEFGFRADWNDLGKADKYKFAIKQNCLDRGKDEWLFFDTLDEINSYLVKFGSENGGLSEGEKGVYAYTLYIVSKNVNGDANINDDNVLDSVAALDTIQVTPDVNLPEAVLDVEGGYTNKVVLKISSLKKNEADVTYKITRTWLEGETQEGNKDLGLNELRKLSDETYEDTTVQGNCRYSYILTATSTSGAWAKSQSQEAETLGKPVVKFNLEALSYDSVTITFDGVLAAKEYIVKLGESGGFGNGEMYTFAAGTNSTVGKATISLSADNTYTVIINKPKGFDDASLAGKTANLTVTARSGVDEAESDPKEVNVLGPALLEASVNTFAKAKENSISLTWKAVDGAKGYLIRRVMYSDATMTKVAENSEVTYYWDASGKEIMANGEKVHDNRAVIEPDSTKKFTLTDTYKENDLDEDNDDPDRDNYQRAQAKIFWGLPFRYIVLPVLNENDFNFNKLELAVGEAGFKYTNLAPTAPTATLGYGMEVHAEKSKNTKEQVITWVKPFYATDTVPRVFRRLVTGSSKSAFALVNDSTELATDANSFAYNPQGDDKYNAYEYVVQYGVVSVPTLNQDLLNDFENRKDAESPTEQANKGYLFTVEDFNLKTSKLAAEHGGTVKGKSNTYAETVKWNTGMNVWEYKNRALGPTGIKLYIMNNNIDGKWHPVAKIGSMDYSGKVESLEDDISAERGSDGISLYPKGIANGSSGTTSGMLKVLRDYKHYYALSLTRDGNDDEELETQKYTPGFKDDKDDYDYTSDTAVYAYRQITNEEMVRAATLAMAIGAKATGTGWNQGGGTMSKNGVTVSTSGGSGNTNLVHKLEYSNFTPSMTTKAGKDVTFLTISGNVTGEVWRHTLSAGTSGKNRPPYEYHCYNNDKITVSAANNDCGGLYSAEIVFNWLNYEANYRDVSGEKKGIKITYPSGNSEKVFGNITPLPFAKSTDWGVFSWDNIDFQQDSAEWQ